VIDARIEFLVPESWGWSERRFTGTFEAGQLIIESPAGYSERLRRGHSFWELSSKSDRL
jgi:hypothetical protein